MKRFSKFLLLTPLLAINISLAQQQLPSNSPEIKQLEAMGYEIEKSSPTDGFTVANTGTTRISFTRNNERTVVSRSFIKDTKLNNAQEFELLKIVNELNSDYTFQTVLNPESLSLNLYLFGPHDPKTFAKVIRLAEAANTIFDKKPALIKLLSKD